MRSPMIMRIAGVAVGAAVAYTPLIVSAQPTNGTTLDDLLVQIASLQRQLAQLRAGVVASSTLYGSDGISSAFSDTAAGGHACPAIALQCPSGQVDRVDAQCSHACVVVTDTAVDSSSCPFIGRTLTMGSQGTDVTSLQTYLAARGYFIGGVTGYFGTRTQAAVQAYQTDQGIVSRGSPSTTGYGVFGPTTRMWVQKNCGQAALSPSTSTDGATSGLASSSSSGGTHWCAAGVYGYWTTGSCGSTYTF